jgi:hypothetical protein
MSRIVRIVILIFGLSIALPSSAQFVPPHIPGTLCLTYVGWCQMPGQYPLGMQCWCGTMNGPVIGQVV